MFVKLDKTLKDGVAKEKKGLLKLEPVQEVKLLMDVDKADDLKILKGLGGRSNLVLAQEEHGRLLDFEAAEEMYNGAIFEEAKIKTLCLDYNLRFLKSRHFKGDMDIQVISKIKEFGKKTGVEVTNQGLLSERFFILAPPEAFNLERKTVTTQIRVSDPIIFFKTNEGLYKMIHKWGRDFTIFRLVSGFKNRSLGGWLTYSSIMLFVLVNLISSTFVKIGSFHNNIVAAEVVMALFSILPCLIYATVKFTSKNGVIPGFFTPTSWNRAEYVEHKYQVI